MNRVWLFLLLGMDIASKALCARFLSPLSGFVYPYSGIGIFRDFCGISFSLNYVVNTGAAWGMFQGHSTLLFLFRLLIIGAMILYLFKGKSLFPRWPLSLVVIGALGNVIDYFLYGHVIDFFHFVFWGYSFPLFNIADSCIFLGVVGLLFFSKSKVSETSQ